jgi:hypothetical protein
MPGMRDDDMVMNHHVIWAERSHWTKGSSKMNSPANKLSILLKILIVGAHCREVRSNCDSKTSGPSSDFSLSLILHFFLKEKL